jgi:predicted CXXCH cytochrome family protein
METHPLRIRPVRGERTPLAFLLVISALSALKLNRLFADYAGDPPLIDNEDNKSAIWSAEHPFIEKRDIKLETCLTCHPGKQDAKFVHTAVGRGCENCHQAASENYKTTITLLATGGDLCAMCHVAKKNPVLHGPYKAGQCLVCHDPHTGAYKAQLRAAVNILCLSCHGLGQPNVKVDPQTKSVVLLGEQKESLDEYARAPKIGGGHPENNPPDRARGAVTAQEAAPNCLSPREFANFT